MVTLGIVIAVILLAGGFVLGSWIQKKYNLIPWK